MASKPERAPIGPVGRFVCCPLSGDTHPERVAYEVRRTWDKNGKERFSAACPICYTRCFLNGWSPEKSMRTIVAVEADGYYPIGVTEARRAELLKELGLRQVHPSPPHPPHPHGWAQQWPAGPVPWLPPPPPPPLPPVQRRRRPVAAPVSAPAVTAAPAAPAIPTLLAPGRVPPAAPALTETTKETTP